MNASAHAVVAAFRIAISLLFFSKFSTTESSSQPTT
jgi:hypothetical protein